MKIKSVVFDVDIRREFKGLLQGRKFTVSKHIDEKKLKNIGLETKNMSRFKYWNDLINIVINIRVAKPCEKVLHKSVKYEWIIDNLIMNGAPMEVNK